MPNIIINMFLIYAYLHLSDNSLIDLMKIAIRKVICSDDTKLFCFRALQIKINRKNM